MNEQLGFALSNVSGISGHEENVRKIMEDNLQDYVDEFTFDKLGSLIGIKKGQGNGPKIMLAAHMDEVGFIVKQIDDNGYLKFSPVGGWWSQVLLGQRVKVVNSQNQEFIGVIGSTPPHVLPKEKRNEVVQIQDMFIDVGAKDKAEVEQNGINIGDMIVPDSTAVNLLNEDFVLGKAWDDRIGCLVLIEVMQRLAKVKHQADVYAVATVQEEIGLKGAKTAANKINPDIAFALDTGIAGDTPGMTKDQSQSDLGKGPQYTIMDGGMIIHNGLKKYIQEVAQEEKIAVQPEILLGGSTDAASINISGTGVPATCISLATRYIHSHNSIISKKDFQGAVDLLVNLIINLDNTKYEEIINS
ncbi:MAG: M42 family metallopeptidase [Mycoplasmatales bacterium]